MEKLWLALAAWVAGILVSLLGYLDAKENCEDKFSVRKFLASVIRSLFAGVVWAVAYPLEGELTWGVILGAIASGPFFDTVVNRIGTLAGNSSFPLPKEKPKTPAPMPEPPAGAAGSTP